MDPQYGLSLISTHGYISMDIYIHGKPGEIPNFSEHTPISLLRGCLHRNFNTLLGTKKLERRDP